ncbi:MAG: DUF460 domain-containing protein [Candidatus Woesearchaeota archaeon]
MEKPLVIVGLDPGTTTAYALLDLNGNFLGSFSAKELSLSQTISRIIEISQPLITCSDKGKTPSFVQDFSASLGTVLFAPSQDLQRQEKRELIQTYEKVNNNHELDSLAAAAYAYKKTKSTLNKIDTFIRAEGLEKYRNRFTTLILKQNLHLQLAKEILTRPTEENQVFQKVIENKQISKTDFLKLFEKYDQSKKENYLLVQQARKIRGNISQLKQSNLFLAKKLNRSDHKIDQLLKFKEDRIKDLSYQFKQERDIVNSLRKEIISLHSFIAKIPRHQLLKRIDNLGQQEFSEKSRLLDIAEKDILFVNNPQIYSEKVLDLLKNKQILLVSEKKFNSRVKKDFTTFKIKRIVKENTHFVLADLEDLEKQINSEDLINLVDSYKKKRENGIKT